MRLIYFYLLYEIILNIKKNIDKPLITINNVISITSYFGIELQKQFNQKSFNLG